MKARRMAGLLALFLAAPLAGAFADDDADKAQALSQEFSVSQPQLMEIHNNQSMSWDDIRTSLMISQHSGASLDEVVRLKKSGMSYEDISSRYQLKLSDIEKQHPEKKTDEFREAPAPRRVHRRAQKLADDYSVPSDEVMRLHDRGLSWKEIRQALYISEQSGRPVNEIVGLKESGMDFDDIAARYNVNLKEEPKRPKERKDRAMRDAPASKDEHRRTGDVPNSSDTPSGSQPGGNQEGAAGAQGEGSAPQPNSPAPMKPETMPEEKTY
ncbi:MAG: hypothetical protein HY925_07215 [Elusimicrobia bacterium]|nr:hypothetical protein [Elusimicrobiota bacterium]